MLTWLKTDQDFAAFKAGKTTATKLLKIRVHYSLNQNSPRFGFIVPKKILPKVVDRNLLKRRIKSILQTSVKNLRPADILIFPSKNLLKLKFPETGAVQRYQMDEYPYEYVPETRTSSLLRD